MSGVPSRILPVIVISQFAATSVWFAGNAVMGDLQARAGWPAEALGDITTAVQAGFISGTFAFAVLAIADRFPARVIFLLCALLAAVFNGAAVWTGASLGSLLVLRFATGFCLAGIYPVGMKIAAGWFDRDLGRALGFLVGALVLGTALPHLIRGAGAQFSWETVLLAVSGVAALGGVLMVSLVPDGPHAKPGAPFDWGAIAGIFSSADFRASSFGYFGHMWELYAFWAFAPAFLVAYSTSQGLALPAGSVALLSFAVIGAGAIGCVVGGFVSLRAGSARVAAAQLAASGLCCLVSPLAFVLPFPAMLVFLMVWGVVVVGDSPQYSALNSRYAPAGRVGTALTIVNSIGFAITIVSIQVLNRVVGSMQPRFLFLLLLPGPVMGLLALRPLLKQQVALQAR